MTAFPGTELFWHKMETLAGIAWDVSSRPFPWPPESINDLFTLTRSLRPSMLRALPYLRHTTGDLISSADPMFHTFLDAQLLISAQTTSKYANALYGSAALSLPRRGVNHVQGGIGALAETLVKWIRQNGGAVIYRQQVTNIELKNGRAAAVTTKKGLRLEADNVVANLTPWALQNLLGKQSPIKFTQKVEQRQATWGAFTLYLGVDTTQFPQNVPAHHQVILDAARPLGEGNSVFVSMSDTYDASRAPDGKRAITLSTHTELAPWWEMYKHNESA